MKCANSSICEFVGVGSYEGSINGHYIKLENVLYSKNLKKSCIIKLAKNGLLCNLKSRKNKVFLILKAKDNNKGIINIGTFKANKSNAIHVTMKNEIYMEN